ncbi:uncharacterized protein EV420DRAFT_1578291 [Desarmillaria tabescens]|uniref:Protein kinase domain-containing protein n=1 Tax=Armillaria tabescens TaxID=1929756 RepID=A0AA39JHF6_ARMTA|nr:uncharacterized protein EV420DRAFT_1578291 [Desarmillaria tabescens]KAK0442499.1 hypothetical protein EV420DRAFT_1578291 [Desarmillaria tabescens]
MSASPPYTIDWYDGYLPMFPLEFDSSDRDKVLEHCDMLKRLRRQAYLNPVHPGLPFEAVFPARQASHSPDHRPLPPFVLKGGRFRLVLWVADVKEIEGSESLGRVVLKLFQDSLMPLPELFNNGAIQYMSPRELAGVEDLVYNALEGIQGTVIPYYYGKYKFLMLNGKSTRAIILEYIEGTTLADIHEKYNPHGPLESEVLTSTVDNDWLQRMKELYIPILKGIKEINTRQVVIPDTRPENIIVTSTEPKRAIFVDFGQALLRVPPNIVAEYGNDYLVVSLLTDCCPEHKEDIMRWAKETLDVSLQYPDFVFARLLKNP